MKTQLKTSVQLVLLAAAFGVAFSARGKAVSLHASIAADDDTYYLPPPNWMRAMSLGYNEAAADLIWVKTVVYFGRSLKTPTGDATERYSQNYLLIAAALDPRFHRLYTDGSTLALFQSSGVVTERSVNDAIKILERGTEVFPDDGEIFFSLGYMHYYEMRPFLLKNEDPSKAEYHRTLGSQLIARSALMKNAPSYAALISNTLLSQEGLDDLLVEHLKARLTMETNPDVRKVLAVKLRHELGKAAIRDIARTDQLVAEWRKKIPYIPFDFYLVIRSEPIESLWDDYNFGS